MTFNLVLGEVCYHVINFGSYLDKLYEWLFKGDNFNDRHKFHQTRRAPNSGIWFLKEFENWMQQSSKCFVCYGTRNPRSSEKLTICSRFREVCFNV
jgi:hypothetical protein